MVCIGLFLIFIAIHSFRSNVFYLLIVSLIFSSIVYAYLIIHIHIYLDTFRRNRLIKDQDVKIKKIEKEILKNPPLRIKTSIGYIDGVPIYSYIPPKEFLLTREVNPKIFKDVHLDKSIKDDLYIDLNKFKKCSKCKRYISIDSRFCVHCGNKL